MSDWDDRAREMVDDWDAEHAEELERHDQAAARGPAPELSMFLVLKGEPVVITRHAAQRYCERASRFDDLHAATADLLRLVRFCGVIGPRPPWMLEGPGEAKNFLMVGQNIALPLMRRRGDWVAVTCVSLAWIRRTRETPRAPRGAKGKHKRRRAA